MEHILSQSLGHGPVPLVGVHHRREDVLFSAHYLYGRFVGIPIKLPGKLIAAVVVEEGGVHIEDEFSVELGVLLQSPGGDEPLLLHPGEHLRISAAGLFEMYIQFCPFRDYVRIGVGLLFPFIVPLCVSYLCGS